MSQVACSYEIRSTQNRRAKAKKKHSNKVEKSLNKTRSKRKREKKKRITAKTNPIQSIEIKKNSNHVDFPNSCLRYMSLNKVKTKPTNKKIEIKRVKRKTL